MNPQQGDDEMNDQQLNQVLSAVEEATVFAPGGSTQLVPVKPMSAAGQKIIEDARKLCDDIIAAYQEQVDAWTAELHAAEKFCARLIAAQEKLAESVSLKGGKADQLRATFVQGIDAHDKPTEEDAETGLDAQADPDSPTKGYTGL